MSCCDGQYIHFVSGRNYFVSLLNYLMPEWRNGRRRGFKIPRPYGRVSSSLTLGTSFPLNYLNKVQNVFRFRLSNSYKGFFIKKSLLKIIFLDYEKYLVTVCYHTSAQFDGEEQKAGAIASVFFRFSYHPLC